MAPEELMNELTKRVDDMTDKISCFFENQETITS